MRDQTLRWEVVEVETVFAGARARPRTAGLLSKSAFVICQIRSPLEPPFWPSLD